jgi:SSS family solute:Na+ symporter
MVAGRRIHPFIMAMSYGATFISTSAIIGFGGVAGLFGMGLLWLTFLNIAVGIFIAFVFLGGRTRRIGHRLDAHTFPELLGKRFESKAIQMITGTIIFLFIPLYSAAVLMGACVFIEAQLDVPYNTALTVFTILIAVYVIIGGLRAVMYTDAFQGTIMLAVMLILLVMTYYRLGGVVEAHQSLTDMAPLVPAPFKAIGHQGWTEFPAFGFGDRKYDLWWIMVSTITLGVGIGVLAQPQLVVRFMTVRSQKELNRAVLIGGLFILGIPGTVYVVGSLSNAFFAQEGPPVAGRVIETLDDTRGYALLQPMEPDSQGEYADIQTPEGKAVPPIPVVLVDDHESESAGNEADRAEPPAHGRSISWIYADRDADRIIPTFIRAAMPNWFGVVFLLTLLCAAMSTLSSQFHTLGTSIGRDVFEQILSRRTASVSVVRISTLLGILLAFLLAQQVSGAYVIARATAIFFGLCSAAFLPAYIGGLFWKRMTRAGALASIITGVLTTAFWLTFIKAKEAAAIGLVTKLTDGSPSLLASSPNWPVVDPIVIALPASVIAGIVVSLITQPASETTLRACFPPPAD